MAYDKTKLRLLGGYPSDNLYSYETSDAVTAVATSGYFDDALNDYNLSAGDVIIAKTGDMAAVDLLLVSGVSPVTVVNGT